MIKEFLFLYYEILGGKDTYENFSYTNDLLLTILIIPLISLIFIYIGGFLNNQKLYNMSLLSATISFFFSLFLWISLEEIKGGFQSTFSFYLIPSFSFSFKLGVDGISIFFVILTNLFIYLCILSLNPNTLKLSEALMHLFFLQWSLIASFFF